jgi:hypothetical protein
MLRMRYNDNERSIMKRVKKVDLSAALRINNCCPYRRRSIPLYQVTLYDHRTLDQPCVPPLDAL